MGGISNKFREVGDISEEVVSFASLILIRSLSTKLPISYFSANCYTIVYRWRIRRFKPVFRLYNPAPIFLYVFLKCFVSSFK